VGLEQVWVGWWLSIGCVLGMSVEFRISVVVVPLCWGRVGPASDIGSHYVIRRWGRRGDRGCVLGDAGCRFKVGGAPASRHSGFHRLKRAIVPFGGCQFLQHCFTGRGG
jgi:hypothetical protein